MLFRWDPFISNSCKRTGSLALVLLLGIALHQPPGKVLALSFGTARYVSFVRASSHPHQLSCSVPVNFAPPFGFTWTLRARRSPPRRRRVWRHPRNARANQPAKPTPSCYAGPANPPLTPADFIVGTREEETQKVSYRKYKCESDFHLLI